VSKTLRVGNLHSETTSQDLHFLCSQFGTVLSAKIMTDEATGASLGFAFVEIGDGANAALEVLHRHLFQGRVLNVQEAKLPEERRRPSPPRR